MMRWQHLLLGLFILPVFLLLATSAEPSVVKGTAATSSSPKSKSKASKKDSAIACYGGGCNDGKLCTHDYCDSVSGCYHIPVNCDICSEDTTVVDMVWVIDWTLLVPVNSSSLPLSANKPYKPVDISVIINRFAEGLQSNYTPPVNARAAIVVLASNGVHVVQGFTHCVPCLANSLRRFVVGQLSGKTTAMSHPVFTNKPMSNRVDAVTYTIQALLKGVTGDTVNLAYRGQNHEKHFIMMLSSLPWTATPRTGVSFTFEDGYMEPANKRDRRVNDIENLARNITIAKATVTILLESARDPVDMADQLDLEFYLGDPATDRAYPDGRGFKRRATIAEYRHNPRIHTQVPLHVQLLVNDITARCLPFHRLHQLSLVDVALYDVPPSIGYACDRCQAVLDNNGECHETLACDYRAVECEPGLERCSSQQGCVFANLSAWEGEYRHDDETYSSNAGGIAHFASGRYDLANTSEFNLERSFLEKLDTDSKRLHSVPLSPRSDPSLKRAPSRRSWTKDHLVKGHVEVRQWNPDEPFIDMLVSRDKPIILRNSAVENWQALGKWDPQWLAENIGTEIMSGVKIARDFTLFDVDPIQPMFRLPAIRVGTGYTQSNMSTKEFFAKMAQPNDGESVYYFGGVSDRLKEDLLPDNMMFADQHDIDQHDHFVWLSSRGPRMHTHFDQDHNVFVQLYGEKLFTLFPPHCHEDMYPFPRIHPLWHKSQVHFDEPNLDLFPNYRRVEAWEAHIFPGDLLYIPPYWWHHVESVTASISLSQWSQYVEVTKSMKAVYNKGVGADQMKTFKGKVWALRLFIDMLLTDVSGRGDVYSFMRRLVQTRYASLQHHFSPQPDWSLMCDNIRITEALMESTQFDVKVATQGFGHIPPELRDQLLGDFIEEVTCSVVGVERTFAFFRYCFYQSQRFTIDNTIE